MKLITPAGNGQYTVELNAVLDGRTVSLTGLADHNQTEAVDEINAWPVHSHLLVARDMSVLDGVFRRLTMGGRAKIRVRYGFSSGDQSVFLPWQTHMLGWYTASPTGLGAQAGPTMKIETRGLLSLLDLDPRARAMKGRISDVVKEIAAFHGLGTIIEPTGFSGAWTQASFETDYKFLRRLLRRATNETGRGGYRLFVQDDVLHFHTPEYRADLAAFDYFGQQAGSSLTFVDNSARLQGLGAAGCTVVTVDARSGLAGTVAQDSSVSSRLAGASPSFIPAAARREVAHVGQNRLAEAQAQAQARYDTVHSAAFEAILAAEGGLFLRLNDLLNLGVAYDQVRVTCWAGLWSVTKEVFSVTRGARSSVWTLNRGELLGNTAGVEVGQPVSVDEVRSSNLTRGAENAPGAAGRTVPVLPP